MALPANLVCNVPAAQSREGWVDIDSGSDAVSRTPFLPWQPMAAAGAAAQQRSRITTLQFARAFGTRCSISRVPADLAAAQGASVVRIRFNGPFWTRVLTELAASGFFVAGLFANLREMLETLTRLALQNPQQLLITAADWSLGQDFVIPAGAGVAAAARRQLLLPTRFISLVTADMLELSPPSPTPLKVLFDLLGFLGPCLTQASREQEVSTFQAAARKLSNSHASRDTHCRRSGSVAVIYVQRAQRRGLAGGNQTISSRGLQGQVPRRAHTGRTPL